MKKNKICLAASGGGHLTELLRLSDSWKDYETFFVTTVPVVEDELKGSGHVYVVGECNRQHFILVVHVLLRCIRVIIKERPDVVISTGAAAGCMICFIAKMFGAKIVWIDSITNVEEISLSGRMVRYIADLFLVQWPELLSKYKNVEFAGTLI
jgi:beta-1,4-N-acetylglucosaminyltransferase